MSHSPRGFTSQKMAPRLPVEWWNRWRWGGGEWWPLICFWRRDTTELSLKHSIFIASAHSQPITIHLSVYPGYNLPSLFSHQIELNVSCDLSTQKREAFELARVAARKVLTNKRWEPTSTDSPSWENHWNATASNDDLAGQNDTMRKQRVLQLLSGEVCRKDSW